MSAADVTRVRGFDVDANPTVRNAFSPRVVVTHLGGDAAGPSAEALAAELGYHEPVLVETQDITATSGCAVLLLGSHDGEQLVVIVALTDVTTVEVPFDVEADEYEASVEVYLDGTLCPWARPDAYEHDVLACAAARHLARPIREAWERLHWDDACDYSRGLRGVA